MRILWIVLLALPCAAQPRWWMDTPVRLVQTNLRETDAGLDARKLVQQVAELRANALLFGMGGIAAYYPTAVELHYPSPHLPPGRDLFGEVLAEAHARGIRVVGRFDLSKAPKAVYDAHPEWFVRTAKGEPVVYNGLYSACINGGYYRRHALKILSEALERYEVDGLFFNMFGNPVYDYSGKYIGPCHCESCRKAFNARFRKPLPDRFDAEHDAFMRDSRLEVAAKIGDLIHAKRPNAGFFTYIQEYVDGIMSESNTAVDRPLPLWPYSASDNVNRARNSEPSKMAINLCMSFVDIPYRFATVPPTEIQLRLYQNMAHGAGPAFAVLGTPEQDDRTAWNAARPVYQWHAEHEDLYVGQESAARVLVLAAGAQQDEYRGLFRILSENHIPFAVVSNMRDLERRAKAYDVVIAPDGAPSLEAYLKDGGRVLATGATRRSFERLPREVRRWESTRSAYFRVGDKSLFPSLKDIDVVFLDGAYLEFEAKSPLTLIPPARFGPPEKVWTDKVETAKPGLLLTDYGRGRLAYLPWNIGALYYRHSSPAHAGLIADIVDHLLPEGRQLKTNAHPLVEITVMRQPARNRTLVHLLNMSGHSQTAYFPPVQMRDIEVTLAGPFHRARSVRLGRDLPVAREGRYARFTLPELGTYDVLVLQ
ncbi:MAG TPA: alpha-amylase family protein [Bryobacteraceae bacterium]|nr:alpha-amylase family protein [Bryobacteraceae bacterium]